MTASADLLVAAGRLPGVSLAEIDSFASLQTRVDRKYVVDQSVAVALLETFVGRLGVLEIEGRREFGYESLYFDTAQFDLHRAAATGRRRRYKVRTRHYLDTATAMLEVKTKDGRGRTIKHRAVLDTLRPLELSSLDCSFVDGVLGTPGAAAELLPALVTRYRRLTVVDRAEGTRLTIDGSLCCATPDGRSVSLDRLVVESKSDIGSGGFDRWLWRAGQRPERISKYCTALGALHPELPANRWRRTLTRHFIV